MGAPRVTVAIEKVLLMFLADPTRERYGLEISRDAALHRGSLYKVLMRMEEAGWLQSTWEEIDPEIVGRPARRLYRLTCDGQKQAEDVRADLVAAINVELGVEPL